MADGICVARRSDLLSPLKRRRDDELDFEGSSRRSSCRWEGCRRPGRLESEGGIRHPFHPFCSSSHRDFFYADLFDILKPGGSHVLKQPMCKLSGCDRPVWVIDQSTGAAYDFCRRGHFVMYKERMTEQWHLEGRLCKLNDCYNHVAVETPRKIHEYCCRNHLYSAAGARGKQSAEERLLASGKAVSSLPQDTRIVQVEKTNWGEGPSRRNEIHQRIISQEAPQQGLPAKSDKYRGYHEKVSMQAIENTIMHLLRNPEDFEGADPCRLFCVVPNVLDFHCFDDICEFGGFRPKYYVHYIDAALGKQRSTIEGFGWKQTSNDHNNKSAENLITNYFVYELRDKSFGGQSEAHLAYLQFIEKKIKKKIADKIPGTGKYTKNRWRLHQFSLSDDVTADVIGGNSPARIPVISRIFQDKRGLPVYPPLPVMANENCEPVHVGTVSRATFHAERGMTSSNSSNASPPGEALPLGSETLLGGSSQSNKCDESNNFPSPDTREVVVNTSNSSVPVEALGEEIFHLGSSSMESKTSPPGGSLLPGGECSQGASSYDIDGCFLSTILEDILSQDMGVAAQTPIGTISDVGNFEDWIIDEE